MTTDSTAEKQKSHLFQPGKSANPKGRPKGSRNKLGEQFLSALCADFEEHGVSVIQKVREDKPDQYLKVVASILPKHLHIESSPLEDLSDDELEAAIIVLNEEIERARAGGLPPKKLN